MSIQQMRKNYTRAGLDKRDVDPDPLVQFERWFDEAQSPELPDWFEINAMTLSTAERSGHVSSRIVLLKGIAEGKFLFFTNYDSAKGKQIAVHPQVSLCFFWPHLERQVRVDGTVTKTDRDRSESYFHSRPRESQLGASVSLQSSVIESGESLRERMNELEVKYAGAQIPCPENWGGYQVAPTSIEFWQGRPSRLHDRICYRKESSQWRIVRLSP